MIDHTSLRAGAVAAVFFALALAATLVAAAVTLSFPRFNVTYRDVTADVLPIGAGALKLSVVSPSNELTLESHGLVVSRRADGTYDVDLAVGFSGSADLELSFGDGVPPLADAVELPSQEVRLSGRASVDRVAGGWEVTPHALPETATLALESDLAGRLESTCRLLAVAVPGVQCGGLEGALAALEVPLPEPGETYVIDAGYLDQEEIEAVDRALGFMP